jgi:hypothetical protein
VEAEVALPAVEIGTCPWCHDPVTIDPLLLQHVCPGCNARFATEAAHRLPNEVQPRRRWPRRSTPATRVAAAILVFALLALQGALLPVGLITMCVIGLMVAVEERP